MAFSSGGWNLDWERQPQLCVLTPNPPMLDPRMPTFQTSQWCLTSASSGLCCKDTDSRPVCRPSASPSSTRMRGKMYMGTRLPLPLKDKCLQSQVPTWALTFVSWTNYFQVESQAQTTLRGCRWVCHSHRRVKVAKSHLSKHPTITLHSSQN